MQESQHNFLTFVLSRKSKVQGFAKEGESVFLLSVAKSENFVELWRSFLNTHVSQ